jgi:hypothetical protein
VGPPGGVNGGHHQCCVPCVRPEREPGPSQTYYLLPCSTTSVVSPVLCQSENRAIPNLLPSTLVHQPYACYVRHTVCRFGMVLGVHPRPVPEARPELEALWAPDAGSPPPSTLPPAPNRECAVPPRPCPPRHARARAGVAGTGASPSPALAVSAPSPLASSHLGPEQAPTSAAPTRARTCRHYHGRERQADPQLVRPLPRAGPRQGAVRAVMRVMLSCWFLQNFELIVLF